MSDHQVLPCCVQVYCEEAWRVSWNECVMAFYAACQRHMMVLYYCGSGSTKNYFVCASYFDSKPMKLLYMCGYI